MNDTKLTLDEYVKEIARIALADGVMARPAYWEKTVWKESYDDGLTPQEAWGEEQAAR